MLLLVVLNDGDLLQRQMSCWEVHVFSHLKSNLSWITFEITTLAQEQENLLYHCHGSQPIGESNYRLFSLERSLNHKKS